MVLFVLRFWYEEPPIQQLQELSFQSQQFLYTYATNFGPVHVVVMNIVLIIMELESEDDTREKEPVAAQLGDRSVAVTFGDAVHVDERQDKARLAAWYMPSDPQDVILDTQLRHGSRMEAGGNL